MNRIAPSWIKARNENKSIFSRRNFRYGMVLALVVWIVIAAQMSPAGRIDSSNILYNDGVVPRVFYRWTHPLPCFPMEEDEFDDEGVLTGSHKPADTGFLFVKLKKVGGSTAAGINIRIAANVAQRLYDKDPIRHENLMNPVRKTPQGDNGHVGAICRSRYPHGTASSRFRYYKRQRDKSFLWAIIREPSQQVISHFFYIETGWNQHEATDALFRRSALRNSHNYFMSMPLDNTQSDMIRQITDRWNMVGGTWAWNGDRAKANQILKDYDFIGVMERLEESAVVLAMLLNVPLADVLYVPSKITARAASLNEEIGLKPLCEENKKTSLSEGMQAYLDSPEWQEHTRWTKALYTAVDRSLDKTIDSLGREKFQANLDLFKKAQLEVSSRCVDLEQFGCDVGQPRGAKRGYCLWSDSACNMACLDDVSNDFNLWEPSFDKKQ